MNNLKMILAMDLEGGIGKNGTLPWHIPNDLKMFKQKTKDCYVAMGKNTWNDKMFPKPMKGRNTVVFCKNIYQLNKRHLADNVINCEYNLIPYYLDMFFDKDLWIIGGAMMYNQLIDYVDEVRVTQLYDVFNCDTFFDAEKLHTCFDIYEQSPVMRHEDLEYRFQTFRRV